MTWNNVAFGTGEPNLKPFLSEAKRVGVHSALTVVSNLAVTLAVKYVCPKWSVSPIVAAGVGLLSTVTYSLTSKAVDYFIGEGSLEGYQEKALLATSVVATSFIFFRNTAAFPGLSLAVLDIGILEVSTCFNQ